MSDSLSIILAILSVGISIVSINIAIKSDRRMKAITGLEYDEKLAVLAAHFESVKDKQSVLVSERIKNDFQAITNLKQYASFDKKNKLIKDYIIPILSILISDKSENGVSIVANEIIIIAMSYNIQISELESLQQKVRCA